MCFSIFNSKLVAYRLVLWFVIFFCYSKKDLLASFLRSLESVDWVIFKYWAIYFNGTKEDMYFMGARLKEP